MKYEEFVCLVKTIIEKKYKVEGFEEYYDSLIIVLENGHQICIDSDRMLRMWNEYRSGMIPKFILNDYLTEYINTRLWEQGRC